MCFVYPILPSVYARSDVLFFVSTNYKNIPCLINSHSSIGNELSVKTEHFWALNFWSIAVLKNLQSQNNIKISWTVGSIAQGKEEIKKIGFSDITPLIVVLSYQRQGRLCLEMDISVGSTSDTINYGREA